MRNIEDPGFEPRLLWPQTCALSVTLGASHSAPTVLPLRNPWEEWGEGVLDDLRFLAWGTGQMMDAEGKVDEESHIY